MAQRSTRRKPQRFSRAFLDRTLAASKVAYETTKNPFEVWDAYRMARLMRHHPPGWVMDYLDEAMQRIWNLVVYPEEVKDLNRSIAEAFGMASSGRGRGSVLSDFRDRRWMFLGATVAQYIRQGDKETIAIEDVARINGTSKSTVRRAWKRWQADPRFQKSPNS
jgi:hypothetical protein